MFFKQDSTKTTTKENRNVEQFGFEKGCIAQGNKHGFLKGGGREAKKKTIEDFEGRLFERKMKKNKKKHEPETKQSKLVSWVCKENKTSDQTPTKKQAKKQKKKNRETVFVQRPKPNRSPPSVRNKQKTRTTEGKQPN